MATKDNHMSEMIPDYCNNRLDANTRAEFETLLREDLELQDECRDFQQSQALYRRIDPAEPSPCDVLFGQIVRKAGSRQMVEKKEAGQSGSLAGAMRSFWQRLCESIALPWMFAAVQAVVIVLMLVSSPEQSTYTTVSAPGMTGYPEGKAVNVVFRASAAESDIRSLLHSVEGSITGGPSREGRYVISIGARSDLDHAVQTLRQSETVVFAEPAL